MSNGKANQKKRRLRRARKSKILFKFKQKGFAIIKEDLQIVFKKKLKTLFEVLSEILFLGFFDTFNFSTWKINIISSKGTMLHIMVMNLEL